MRHAGAPMRGGRSVVDWGGVGALALVTGFTIGTITGHEGALPSAEAAATVSMPTQSPVAPLPAAPATTSVMDPTEPPAVEPTETVDDVEETVEETVEEDWGDAYVDEQWPADEKGDGCAAPVWPAAAPDAPRVLIIGDSLIRDSRQILEEELTGQGWAPTVRCWGAKGTDWGVGQVERARELGQLPDTVIVSLGTNDVWWLHIPMEQAIDQMMASLGPDRVVYWVNMWWEPSAYDDLPEPGPVNDILVAKSAEYPNLIVIDVAGPLAHAIESGEAGWIDGVHVDERGSWLRTSVIVDALGSAA